MPGKATLYTIEKLSKRISRKKKKQKEKQEEKATAAKWKQVMDELKAKKKPSHQLSEASLNEHELKQRNWLEQGRYTEGSPDCFKLEEPLS